MTRLKKAIDELRKKGYSFSSLQQLKGGLNSAVYHAKNSTGQEYALKIYPLPTTEDTRNRCLTEQNFLQYIRWCKIDNAPKIIEVDINQGWALLSWIEGEQEISMQPADLEKVANFILEINKPATRNERMNLELASEACENLVGLVDSVGHRIIQLESINPSTDLDHSALKWISDSLKPRFNQLREDLLGKNVQKSHWNDIESHQVASPSDVGIHNIISRGKELYFIDFEYAGRDDLSKLAADWILQPEHNWTSRQEYIFIDALQKKMKEQIGETWLDRMYDIKPLIHLKWCLIMLKSLKDGRLSRYQLKKVNLYFQNR